MDDTTNNLEPHGPLQCPKCDSPMKAVTLNSITVDRCTSCQALWFDALEKEHLEAIKGLEQIDIGAPRPVDEKARHPCPVCHTPMIRMTDHREPSRHFESCTVCFGVFYDAGELRKHEEHSIVETFKRWLHG